MNILLPVTLAAASLVLGTRSTSEGSCLLFFILQGQVDSAVLQAEKHVRGKGWGSRREPGTPCSARGPAGPCTGQGGDGGSSLPWALLLGASPSTKEHPVLQHPGEQQPPMSQSSVMV